MQGTYAYIPETNYYYYYYYYYYYNKVGRFPCTVQAIVLMMDVILQSLSWTKMGPQNVNDSCCFLIAENSVV